MAIPIIPHAGPARLVLDAAAGGSCRLHAQAGADPWALLEGAAQAVAAAGAQVGGAMRGGMLVAVPEARWNSRLAVSEVTARVEPGPVFGALRSWAATVSDLQGELFACRVTIADTGPAEPADDPGGEPAFTPLAASARARRHGQSCGVVASGRYRFGADLPVLAGHFPGRPLLPGAYLLACAQDCLMRQQSLGGAEVQAPPASRAHQVADPGHGQSKSDLGRKHQALVPQRLAAARFLMPLVPPVEVRVLAVLGDGGRWRITIAGPGGVACTAELVLA